MPSPIAARLLAMPLPRPAASAANAADAAAASPPPLSFLPGPSNNPAPAAHPAAAPDPPALRASTALLTDPPGRFLYAAPRFLNLPVNTRTPEVCVLGRSNVGKSTLVNALAGVASAVAGRSHRAVARSGSAGPAVTSARAGSTRTMNAYGFGRPPPRDPAAPPPPPPPSRGGIAGSRSRRRGARAGPPAEPPARHALVLVDMPGYGANSRAEWGVEVAKYLARRAALRGAVLLVDAVAGVKEGDRMVLGLLRDAGVRTAVVLTKADKLGYGAAGAAGGERVRRACLEVWEELRRAEEKSLTWLEGKGWESEVWVTGAGDPKNGGFGVEGARLAICRMAGLVEDGRVLEVPVPAPTTGKIVSFDQLQWAGHGALDK